MEHRPPEATPPVSLAARRDRQSAEIITLISARRLDRAADLAHEHLAEFPCDGAIRSAVVVALDTSPDHRLRRRVTEFVV